MLGPFCRKLVDEFSTFLTHGLTFLSIIHPALSCSLSWVISLDSVLNFLFSSHGLCSTFLLPFSSKSCAQCRYYYWAIVLLFLAHNFGVFSLLIYLCIDDLSLFCNRMDTQISQLQVPFVLCKPTATTSQLLSRSPDYLIFVCYKNILFWNSSLCIATLKPWWIF